MSYLAVSILLDIAGPPPPYTDDAEFHLNSCENPPPYDYDISPPEYSEVVDMRAQEYQTLTCPVSGVPIAACRRCNSVWSYYEYARILRNPDANEWRDRGEIEIMRRMEILRGCAESMDIMLPSSLQDIQRPEISEPGPEAEQRMRAFRARMALQATEMASRGW